MAKTESTAVNELIHLVQTKQAAPSEPAADLFAAPMAKPANPPRMTTAVPHMRGAGEIAPLPRGRAPQATSNVVAQMPPPVRMSTAEESRGNTIPPISRPTVPSLPNLPPPTRNTIRGTQPPPHKQTGGARSVPPPSAPVAAPFEARPTPASTLPFGMPPVAQAPIVPQQYPIVRPPSVDMTGDMVKSDHWFELSVQHPRVNEDETWLGTAPVVKERRQTLAIVKKMIAPTIILAIVGIMVGGYFVFDGQGGKKHQPKRPTVAAAGVPAAQHVATQAPAAKPQEPVAKPQEAKPEVAAPADDTSIIPAATHAALTHDAPKAPATPTAAPTAAPKAPPAAAPTAPAKVAAAATPAPKPETAAALTSAPPAAAPAKAVAASGQPAVREVKTPQGVLKFVDVRIDSKPSGATVMLVDNGKSSFLGTTPIATSLDPTRSYDVIFTYSTRPAQMAHLDPSKSSRLDVTLGRHVAQAKTARVEPKQETKAKEPKQEPKAEPKAEPKEKTHRKTVSDVVATPKPEVKQPEKIEKIEKFTPATDDEDPLAAKKPAPKKPEPKKEEPAGQGTLMVSSKPPCEIWIDGKATGLSTPQKSIALTAGMHKVTFVNDAEGIKKTVSVSISADQPTKLIQDLMKK